MIICLSDAIMNFFLKKEKGGKKKEKINKAVYLNLWQCIKKNTTGQQVFHHDNAPSHTAPKIK
jgi:hypothetical protein